jgi:hypothetical protein
MKTTKTSMLLLLAIAVLSLAGCPAPGDDANPGAGFTVYTAGTYGDYNYNPCYWVGTTKNDLPSQDDSVNSLFVSGNTVYTGGNRASWVGGCYWVNTSPKQILPGSNTQAYSIFVSGGTVYTAGSIDPYQPSSPAIGSGPPRQPI